jgi:hypothetical protein
VIVVKKRLGSHPVERSFVAHSATTMALHPQSNESQGIRDQLLEDNRERFEIVN